MLLDAENLKKQMSNQVNDLMGLVGKAEAESSDLSSKLHKKASSDVKNKWKLAQASFKEEKVQKEMARLQTQLDINQKEQEKLTEQLHNETERRQARELEIEELENDIVNKGMENLELQDISESRRVFAMMIALRLGLEHFRLWYKYQSEILRGDDLEVKWKSAEDRVVDGHRAIALHVNSNDKLRARIQELELWCKKSHTHRRRLEELTKRFEIEMQAARDAIWSQSLKNKEMQESLTQMSSDQVLASEIRAKMLHRLQISEMRRIELEERFSTLARASTPLMEEIRAVERHGDNVIAEDHALHAENSIVLDNGVWEEDGSSDGESNGFGGRNNVREKAWVSPYLRRKGFNEDDTVGEGNMTTATVLDLTATARMQQQSLVTLEEKELLNPSANQLLFIGANNNTNMMAVMLLEQKGYGVRTVSTLKELNRISKEEGCDELAYGIDLVLVDLNVVRLSVEFVMRILGGRYVVFCISYVVMLLRF